MVAIGAREVEAAEAQELAEFDGEFNSQVIPREVWSRLLKLYGQTQHTTMHKGRFTDMYTAYMHGVSDALMLARVDVAEAVRLNY